MLLRYLAARWRYRGSSAKRFIRSGLGLERRAHHLSLFWGDHLSRTRAAQARWAQTAQGHVLTVLGAGPLYDFNAGPLVKKFQRFRLVDANPLAQSDWGRLNIPVEPVITDISNVSELWSQAIRQFSGSWPETLDMIRNLDGQPVPAYAPQTDALLSLNILSQLEVGWQETVEPLLQKRFGRTFVQQHEQEWLDAIRPGSRTLAERHLAALAASGAQNILLISDAEYAEYKGRSYTRDRWDDPPLEFSDSTWRKQPGIHYELTPALEGLSLNRELLELWLPSYELEWQESWLWHIAPQGIETPEYGTLHRVAAFALRQRVSESS